MLHIIGGVRADFRTAEWDRHSEIVLYRPETGVMTKIIELPLKRRWTSSGLTVSPDHKRFLYSAYDFQADLMLLDNFR
jgi:hypothetical protein